MGFKNRTRCLSCLAAGLARERRELRNHLFAYVDHHECLRAGWDWASRREGFDPESPPACLWDVGEDVASVADTNDDHPRRGMPRRPTTDAEWDAGDLGCGDLVLELRTRLQSMKPGEILKLTARDPGAPEDLPAGICHPARRIARAAAGIAPQHSNRIRIGQSPDVGRGVAKRDRCARAARRGGGGFRPGLPEPRLRIRNFRRPTGGNPRHRLPEALCPIPGRRRASTPAPSLPILIREESHHQGTKTQESHIHSDLRF
jgi:TusA-related sulfurtransferase